MTDFMLAIILTGFLYYLFFHPLSDEEKQINIKAEYEEEL